MPAKNASRRTLAARIAAIERHNGPDDPRLIELRRDLRAAELEERIVRELADQTPLTREQRLRCAVLLVGAA